jgi:hypothetical protein
MRFVLLIEAGGHPKIHRSLGRDTPSQIMCEIPRTNLLAIEQTSLRPKHRRRGGQQQGLAPIERN